MNIDRVGAEKFLAMLGFALSFLLLLAIVALAFTDIAPGRQASQDSANVAHRCAALPWQGPCR
jgi:hypothetical protein